MLNTVEIKWILVDDGSSMSINTQDTERIAREIKNFEAIFLDSNFGKGYAIRKGMQHVQAETYLYTDIDFPYRNEDLAGMYERSCAAGDLLLASRNEQYYEKVARGRTLISKLFKRAIRFLFNIPTTDTQAGLKVLSQAARDLLLQTRVDRYLFDLELVKLSAKNGLKIIEYPVQLKDNISLSKVSYRILFTEFINLFRILFQ